MTAPTDLEQAARDRGERAELLAENMRLVRDRLDQQHVAATARRRVATINKRLRRIDRRLKELGA